MYFYPPINVQKSIAKLTDIFRLDKTYCIVEHVTKLFLFFKKLWFFFESLINITQQNTKNNVYTLKLLKEKVFVTDNQILMHLFSSKTLSLGYDRPYLSSI